MSGLDCGSEASDWITFTDPKGTKKSPYRILRIEAPISRHKDPKYSPMLREDDLNVFHDGCHMLFANERTAEDICNMINKKAASEHQRKVQRSYRRIRKYGIHASFVSSEFCCGGVYRMCFFEIFIISHSQNQTDTLRTIGILHVLKISNFVLYDRADAVS